MRAILNTTQFIASHPLSPGGRLAAFKSWMRWHVGLRITGQPMVFDYVDGSRLVGRLGVHNSSAAYWVGLIEPEWGGFLLHYLRPEDVFYDVGANIGVLTIVAGVVCGARCVAFEPVPETFGLLLENIRLNGHPDCIELRNEGVGETPGTIKFTTGEGSMNHALARGEIAVNAVSLPLTRLDDVITDRAPPTVLKVDVEGFEHSVIAGAGAVLESPGLNVVMLELRNHGARYGFDEGAVHGRIIDCGFTPVSYDPFTRRFGEWKRESEARIGDVLYLRDRALAEARVAEARRFKVRDTEI